MAHKIDWNELSFENEILGWGSYGDVYKAFWNSKDRLHKIVIKKFRPFIEDSAIEKEFGLLSLTNHDNIVKLLGIAKDGDSRTVMVMEYAECGSLHKVLYQYEVCYMRPIRWMLQCAKGIEYLHEFSPQILHRDLKPQNLLIFNDYSTLKICDFGSAKELDTKMSNGVGTARYMAPEVSIQNSYTEKCDVYSFGITFWEVMSKKKPFYHLRNTVDFHIQKKAIEEQCWDGDSQQRPAMQEVIRDIQFCFFKHEDKYLIDFFEKCEQEYHWFKPSRRYLCNPQPTVRIKRTNFSINEPQPTKIKWIDISINEYIGSGTFSDVFKAIWRAEDEQKIIAVKTYRHSNSYSESLLTELSFESRPCHENILTYYGITTNSDGRTCLLSEYADCGTLYNALHLGNSSYKNALTWMLQLTKGVAFMHQQNIIHGDLKPKKLLLFNNYQTLKISISDFICSKPTTMTKMVGESYYMAPEIVEGSKRRTKKCDVYSFGIILWEVMSRKKPFYNLENETRYFILNKVMEGLRLDVNDLNDVNGIQNSAQIKMWITNCWDADPEKRPTMHGLMTNFTNLV